MMNDLEPIWSPIELTSNTRSRLTLSIEAFLTQIAINCKIQGFIDNN